jgi:anthranilate phosphoribosyltransferase
LKFRPPAYAAFVLQELTSRLERGLDLAPDDVSAAVAWLVEEHVATEAKADFLTALARKGETVEEIAAFAGALREKSISPPLDVETRARALLDVCGTGGDHLGTFNISTTVAIVAAAAGVPVAKHGNRAITSQAGSADVLEALGIRIELSPDDAAHWLREEQFAFFFAPKFHPAFQHIGPARRLCAQRGQRTIFNLLGPLLNPARPSAQLVGVPRPELCEPIARVLQALGVRRGMVVSGAVENSRLATEGATSGAGGGRPHAGGAVDAAGGIATAPVGHLDELSTLGPTTVAEFYQDRGLAVSTLAAGDFGVLPATLADLQGGNREANAGILQRILRGEERGPQRDAVLLNAGAALLVAGRARSITEGWEQAAELIDGGRAARKLEALQARSR